MAPVRATLVALVAVFTASANLGLRAEEPKVKPRALRPGDTIAIVAPSRPLDRERIERATGRLEAMGFKVKLAPNDYERYGFLAGTDEERARGFTEAWLDPEVAAVFPGTGGSGATRLLNMIDFEMLAKSQPKMLIGFSDISALHLAFQAKTNLITFHTPSPQYGLGSPEGMDPHAEKYFWRALLAESYETAEDGPGWTYDIDDITTKAVTINGGRARGRLIGGNLSLVAALSGTDYEVQAAGRILFLEDVGEEPYRVDRMLSTLMLDGQFEKPAGVILGMWRNCEAEEPEKSLSLDQIFDDYFKDKPYPVIKWFPVGHVAPNTTLPEGAMAELDGDARRLTILEDPVEWK